MARRVPSKTTTKPISKMSEKEQAAHVEWLLQQNTWANDEHGYGILKWAVALQLKNETGAPLEWRDRKFLLDILGDMHPYQVTTKCSQVGETTTKVFKAYFLAQVMGRRVIYSLPTDDLVEDLSTTKLEFLEKFNPRIKPTGTNNKTSKSWDKGYILFRGTKGTSQDVMVTADYIIADEVNHSDINVVKGLQSRLAASPIQAEWWFGHPTYPGKGVDEKWRESDQREWHIKCRGCGDEQPLDFWQNIDLERRIYVCRSCHHEISDDDRRQGRWLPTVDEVDGHPPMWHGYHISHLIAPWISAAKVIEAEKQPKDHFFSKVLGLPYIGGGGAVDPTLIRQANKWPIPETVKPLQKFIGVDVGGPLHVVIGNESGITKCLMLYDEPGYNSDVPSPSEKPGDKEAEENHKKTKWGKLDLLMTLEQPNLVVIDNLPSGKQQVAFQKRHPLHVLRCIYDYNNKRQDDFEKDSKEGTLKTNRTRIIDTVLKAFGDGELPVYMEPNDPYFDAADKGTSKIQNCLVHHWGTLYQSGGDGQDANIVKKDRLGNVIRTWENAGPDHLAHATVYYFLARNAGKFLGTGSGGFMPGAGTKGEGKKKDPLDDWDEDDDVAKPGMTFYSM